MTKNHIALFEPQIPANTGNIARTCAATNSPLHLIYPLGFSIDDKHLKRAGLDYWNDVDIHYHDSLEHFLRFVGENPLYLITKFANQTYAQADLTQASDQFFLFGKETTGLPEDFMRQNPEKCLRLPMDDTHVRSLNLSNTVAIIAYEALRQQHFKGLDLTHHYQADKLK